MRSAVAVCLSCGAAVCISHAVIRQSRPPVGPGSTQPSTSEVPTRTITCLACAQAGHGSLAEQTIRTMRSRH
ncbi:MAG: DUF2180 family protein [Actinomycetota bacterium]|nr:DUF2180 family protein [Actinomycetota bacterium]